MWKLWGLQTPYWEGLILISLGTTTVTLLLVKTIIYKEKEGLKNILLKLLNSNRFC